MGRYIKNNRLLFVVLLIVSCSFIIKATSKIKVALVLGGGAARGFSHIGIIEALEDNGIPIDILVGTSMGSIVSGLYATGYSVDNIKEIIMQVDPAKLIDIRIPLKGGLIETSKFEHYLDTLFFGKEFNELEIPFYSVITQLNTGEELALNSGKVSTGVQASMSIPVLFPPVLIDGHYYVDGGLKNAVPVNVAVEKNANVIIAVDVKKDLEEINYDSVLNNFQLTMWFMIDGYVDNNISSADVVIVPEVKYDSYMDYQKRLYFIEQGYQAGIEYIEDIKMAILTNDPTFQFVPYKQVGFPKETLNSLLKEAEDRVKDIPQPLSLVPEILFNESNLKVGLVAKNFPLPWFNVGYRYGFSSSNQVHEVFLGYNKADIGEVELFVLKAKEFMPTIGFKFSLPMRNNTQLQGRYQWYGEPKWELIATNNRLLVGKNFSFGAKILLSNYLDYVYISTIPTLKLFPEEHQSLMEITLFRPYLYTGLEVASKLFQLEPKTKFLVGVGGEFSVFGLYPIDVNFGFGLSKDSKCTFRFDLQKVIH